MGCLRFVIKTQIMQISRLTRSKAVLLVCDIQQNFIPKVYGCEGFLQASIMALKVANIFKMPVFATEHNPKAFGKLVKPMSELLPPAHHLIQKTTFSMINGEMETNLKKYSDRNQAILVGMETHACILQTFLDLKSKNYDIFLPVDAITSIRSWERTIALQRMQHMGAVLTSVESMSFELLRDYKDDNFKAIAKLLKDTGKRSNAIDHL